MNSAPYRVYVVTGECELAEGSVWKGAMAGGHFGLAKSIESFVMFRCRRTTGK